jgi:hypothetical protein
LRVERHASARIAPCRSSSPILPVLSRAGLALGLPTLGRLSVAPVIPIHAVRRTALFTLLRSIALHVVALRALAGGPILLALRAVGARLALHGRLTRLRRSIAGSRSLASRGTASILRGTLGAALWHLRAGRRALLACIALGRLRRGQGDARQERSGTQ